MQEIEDNQPVAAADDSAVTGYHPVILGTPTQVTPSTRVLRSVHFRRFKQFKNRTAIDIEPGITLLAGGNNSGKSSLLHGIAVWEFCKTATLMERGPEGILPEAVARQGFGLGDDEFSPINLPSLKHLWHNLKTAKNSKEGDIDGYTLQIGCSWTEGALDHCLEFALSLANDRLFIKVAKSTLTPGQIPLRSAYLPPFAGIQAREERIGGAIRRRRVGEGLAGAVLRNLLLDMQIANTKRRAELKLGRRKILDADLRRLRDDDPWELLMTTIREIFKAEIQIEDFSEEYHSYIKATVDKGSVDGYKLTRHPGYVPHDLMVEGSGFLQWLSVYTLAVTPDLDIIMFDEPDAHLHPTLQKELVDRLIRMSSKDGRQVLIATHSSEILRGAAPADIMHMRRGGHVQYLKSESQKVGLLAGLGSDYAPRIDSIRRTRKVLFHEGVSDLAILRAACDVLDTPWNDQWIPWQTPAGQKERRALWLALESEIPGLVAYSLRDRDDDALNTVGDDLTDKLMTSNAAGFVAKKWRRRYIESYLVVPEAIAMAANLDVSVVEATLKDEFAIAIPDQFTGSYAPTVLMDVRSKAILRRFGVDPSAVVRLMEPTAICDDLKLVLDDLSREDDRKVPAK